MVMDFSCGLHSNLSSGTRSRVFRVLAISWSNSGSSASLNFISLSPESEGQERKLCHADFADCLGPLAHHSLAVHLLLFLAAYGARAQERAALAILCD